MRSHTHTNSITRCCLACDRFAPIYAQQCSLAEHTRCLGWCNSVRISWKHRPTCPRCTLEKNHRHDRQALLVQQSMPLDSPFDTNVATLCDPHNIWPRSEHFKSRKRLLCSIADFVWQNGYSVRIWPPVSRFGAFRHTRQGIYCLKVCNASEAV